MWSGFPCFKNFLEIFFWRKKYVYYTDFWTEGVF